MHDTPIDHRMQAVEHTDHRRAEAGSHCSRQLAGWRGPPQQAGGGRLPPSVSQVRGILAAMNKPRLIYFDAPVSRGEECRLALHLAGVDFEDVRIKGADWPAMKEQTPYGGLPVLELPGKPPIAHCNAILVLIGRRHDLHPADDFEAAWHEGMMQHVEDLRGMVSPTIRMAEAEKKAAREALVTGYLPAWARAAERNIQHSPFFAGEKLHVVDLKIFLAVRWFIGGKVDHIPATIFADCPRLTGVYEAVRDHAGVRAWYAKT
jgi:glutathione S-transferase